jgi:hypothetical protein
MYPKMVRKKRIEIQKPMNLMKLESPGKPYQFDLDYNIVFDIAQHHAIEPFISGLSGKSTEEIQTALSNFGGDLMRLTIKLADTKYLDRAGVMLERVAKQTGVSFPHRLQRYIEMYILGSRPDDKWDVVNSTPEEIIFQVYSCAFAQEMEKQNLSPQKYACQTICAASFQAAIEKTGDPIQFVFRKSLANDSMCEFSFTYTK